MHSLVTNLKKESKPIESKKETDYEHAMSIDPFTQIHRPLNQKLSAKSKPVNLLEFLNNEMERKILCKLI